MTGLEFGPLLEFKYWLNPGRDFKLLINLTKLGKDLIGLTTPVFSSTYSKIRDIAASSKSAIVT